MIPSQSSPESRREFLRSSGRSLGLAGLAALVIGQSVKSRRLATDPNCLKLATCKECVEFHGCDRDKARLARVSEK